MTSNTCCSEQRHSLVRKRERVPLQHGPRQAKRWPRLAPAVGCQALPLPPPLGASPKQQEANLTSSWIAPMSMFLLSFSLGFHAESSFTATHLRRGGRPTELNVSAPQGLPWPARKQTHRAVRCTASGSRAIKALGPTSK